VSQRYLYNKYSNPSQDWERTLITYCNFISDRLKSYLVKKNMTTECLSKKIDISQDNIQLMLSDVYIYNFSVEEMAKLDLLFEGHYDIYEKKLLTEKLNDIS
tara:strand:- start:1050 stop:1355 length:306 start_codon:yes stop_codon:yes gene_type:complete